MKKIFISYSHVDERFKNELVKHLYPLVENNQIVVWEDGLIEAGDVWDDSIKNHIRTADIVLLLVSADSITSSYIKNVEIKEAIERNNKGLNKVVPVILRPCAWTLLPIATKQGLPKFGKPISKWDNEDEALLDVVKGIIKII